MAQADKARFYGALKDAGVTFDKHYREYSTEELQQAYEQMREEQPGLFATEPELLETPPPGVAAVVDELPGMRLNTQSEDEPLYHDPETGFTWFQREVRKPEYPKPRGRRVLTYNETGTQQRTVTTPDGMTETFEVAGDQTSRAMQAKITLPSYQVGIYRAPNMPFKIHVYNEMRGFDFFEVNDYYGGVDLVPEECKRMYVENVLCYDIRTVVRAIQTEYRTLQLQGKVE